MMIIKAIIGQMKEAPKCRFELSKSIFLSAYCGIYTLKKTAPKNYVRFLNLANLELYQIAAANSQSLLTMADIFFNEDSKPAPLLKDVYFVRSVFSRNMPLNKQDTNQIDFIDLSVNSGIPDNLELILPRDGKMLFIGRETLQVYTGLDPTTNDDGQGLQFPDFQWEMTLPVGILQRTLYHEKDGITSWQAITNDALEDYALTFIDVLT